MEEQKTVTLEPPTERTNGASAEERPEPARELNRGQRKWVEKKNAQARHVQQMAHVQALKDVASQINATAQLAVRTLEAIALKEISLSRIDGRDAALLVVQCEPGRDLDDRVADELTKLLGLPLVVLPRDMKLEAISTSRMEAAGWTRKGPIGVASDQAEELKKS